MRPYVRARAAAQENAAAMKVQAVVKGRKSRKDASDRAKAAEKIGKAARGRRSRRGDGRGGDGSGGDGAGGESTGQRGKMQRWALRKGLPANLQAAFDAMSEEELVCHAPTFLPLASLTTPKSISRAAC